ncbi:ATP-binding protein [Rhodopila globiformis]|uniref:histidine kinase n=1 Tax=Rhodopila globiformis TaxID=1071 RepID=A0A2S6MZI3_RHOGL|nr:ATP-binding protein [Rhodopila globiformis]PPQ27756.1 hypothetical protein CCS01_26575 [Rhodopila globiformis]
MLLFPSLQIVPAIRGALRSWLAHLAFGAMALAVVATASWRLGESYIDQFRAQRENAALTRAAVAAEALEQTLLRSIEAVEGIQALTQTRENLLRSGDEAGAAAIAEHLRGLVHAEQFGVLQVSTINAAGWLSWTTPSGKDPMYLGDREHFLVHRNGETGLFISTPSIGRASGRWSVQLTRPLLNDHGGFDGVSVVSFDPIKLSNTLANLRFGENSVSVVLRFPDGRLVARSFDAERQLARPGQPDHPVIVAARTRPIGTLRMVSTVTGRPMLAAYRIVGATPLLVVVALDARSELADVASLARSVHVAMLSAPLLTVALWAVMVLRAVRRRSRAELRISRSRGEAAEIARAQITRLLAGLPAAVYSACVAWNGRIVRFSISENVERLTGWPNSRLVNRSDWTERVEDVDAEAWKAHYQAVLNSGEATIEYGFRRPDGTTMWLRDQARVLDGRCMSDMEIVGYISDITEERSLRAQTIATAKLATLGEMAAGLGHELNQPIAIMSLAAENASRALGTKGAGGIAFAVQRMKRIAEQASRARTIVDHLRIFGRKDEDQLGLVDVAAVVDGAMTLVANALHNAGVTVRIDLPDDLPQVLARKVLAEQVLLNLMLNARDAMATNPSEVPCRITITAAGNPAAGTVVLDVRDAGLGIPETVLGRMFDPFFTTKDVGKGTGLGLSICHGIMRSFGGTIAALNADGGGAILRLTFRRASNAAAGDSIVAPRTLAEGAPDERNEHGRYHPAD